MQDLTQDAVTRRVDELLRGWQEPARRVVVRSAPLELAPAVDATAHYLPYLLATIYYAVSLYGKAVNRDHLAASSPEQGSNSGHDELLNLWIDQVLNRVLQFSPLAEMDRQQCRQDVVDTSRELLQSMGGPTATGVPDLVSARLFNAIKRHHPAASDRDRALVEYVVRAELKRLVG